MHQEVESYAPSVSSSSVFKEEDDASSLFSNDSDYLMEIGDGSDANETVLPKTDFHSPFYVNVPTPNQSPLSIEYSDGGPDAANSFVREYPTDILLDRFTKWRKILKGIANYLREVSYAQEQFARINYQLKGSVKFPFLTDLEETTNRLVDPLVQKGKKPAASATNLNKVKNIEEDLAHATQSLPDLSLQPGAVDDSSSASSGFMKFGSGSVQDIQVVLKKYHLSLANQQLKMSKELTSIVIPRIDELRKDLQAKIKEIKELHGDFRTNINEHVALTGQLLQKYMASIKFISTHSKSSDALKLKNDQHLKPKHDPYLLKLQLDLQLKRQLLEENYLQEAYINLQSSGMELEKIIFGEIQHTLQRYSTLIDTEARVSINNLCHELHQGILNKPPAVEWDHFVGHHPKCLINWKSTEPIPQPRKLSDIRYPRMKSALAKCIRAGYLLKKSKILKNYNKGYFVLTSNYLHEFKSSNFFKQTQDTTEKKDHGEVQTGHKKRGLTPVMSIPLNESILMESSDNKFALHGMTTFSNQYEKKSTDTGKMISKSTSTIHKILKTGAKVQAHKKGHNHTSLEKKPEIPTTPVATESNKVTTWVFKTVSQSTPEDAKDFKKWVTELKNLTTFNNSMDRAKFIEEKILRAHSRASSLNLIKLNSENSVNSASLSRIALTPVKSSRVDRDNKPHFIQIGQQPLLDPASLRSKVNTPAIDDNGNLIMAMDGRPPSVFSVSALSSPHQSPNQSAASIGANSGSSQGGQTSPQSHQGFAITSNGVTAITHAPAVHKRNVSIHSAPTSGPNSDHSSPNVPISTPGSVLSGGSGGGYFAIPVRATSQSSTPNSVSGDVIHGSHSQASLPRVRLNDQDMAHERSERVGSPTLRGERPGMTSRTSDGQLASRPTSYHNVRKSINSSATSLSSGGESLGNLYLNPRQNNSAHALTSTKTQPIRKHRKNVSFGSLNSLLFSKKAGDVNNNNMTDYFMSGNRIQENDDDTINLNQSLYS
ncbi:LAFE_0D05512g1_1 [Lachancea fermentati]|uniref:LAFE_0D05512g1_1 n=1 Tax=Lachancea fermentati TaxID=4955 RepID=A0A1G4MB55_LACFM|nr:LAFE_0D05512g1_1 [Lachancea fermentati]